MATKPQPLPSTVKMVLTFDNTPGSAKNQAANVLHMQYPGTMSFTATELTGVANGAFTWWQSHFSPLMSQLWRLNGISITAVDGTGVQGISTHAPIVASGTAGGLPPQSSVCISWKGAPAYRGGKPRTYLAGIPSTAQLTTIDSTVAPLYASAVKTAAVAAIADTSFTTISAAVAVFGAVSYVKGKQPDGKPLYRDTPLFWPFLTAVVHERLDSQRRRSGKEGAYPVT